MRRFLVILLVGLAVVAGGGANANAATPSGNDNYGRQYGNVVRAVMAEHANGSGSTLMIYGSSACTASTSTPDISIGNIRRNNWRNAISRAADFNRCDIWFFKGENFSGTSWPGGYKHWGTGGAYVGDSWNDSIGSFRIS